MTLKEMIENFKARVESNPRYKEMLERLKRASESNKNAEQEDDNNANN